MKALIWCLSVVAVAVAVASMMLHLAAGDRLRKRMRLLTSFATLQRGAALPLVGRAVLGMMLVASMMKMTNYVMMMIRC